MTAPRDRDRDDARDTLKTLHRQAIGSSSALLFLEWAALEWESGAREKASALLAKGLREGAQPPHALEAALADVAAGAWRPTPIWQQPAALGPHTAALTCTGSTYEAFVTPGAEVERPARASHTHTLVCAGGWGGRGRGVTTSEGGGRATYPDTSTDCLSYNQAEHREACLCARPCGCSPVPSRPW